MRFILTNKGFRADYLATANEVVSGSQVVREWLSCKKFVRNSFKKVLTKFLNLCYTLLIKIKEVFNMIKDDNKYIAVKLSREEDARITEKARELHLSKSALVGAIIAGALSYESGKAIGDAFAKFLFGGGSDGK